MIKIIKKYLCKAVESRHTSKTKLMSQYNILSAYRENYIKTHEYTKGELAQLLSNMSDYIDVLNVKHDYQKIKKEKRNIKYMTITNIIHFLILEKETEHIINKQLTSNKDYIFYDIIIHNTNLQDNNLLTEFLYSKLEYPIDHMLFKSLFINKIDLLIKSIDEKHVGIIEIIPDLLINLRGITFDELQKLVNENNNISNLFYKLIEVLNTKSNSKANEKLLINLFNLYNKNNNTDNIIELFLLIDGLKATERIIPLVENINDSSEEPLLDLHVKNRNIKSIINSTEIGISDNHIYKSLLAMNSKVDILTSKDVDVNFNSIYTKLHLDYDTDFYIKQLIILFSKIVLLLNDYEVNKDEIESYIVLIRFDQLLDILSLDSIKASKHFDSLLQLVYNIMNTKNIFGYVCSINNILRLIVIINYNKVFDDIDFLVHFICYNTMENISAQLTVEDIETKLLPVFLYLNRLYVHKSESILRLESLKEFINEFQKLIYNNISISKQEISVDLHSKLIKEIKYTFEIGKMPILDKEFVLYLIKNDMVNKQLIKKH